MNKKNKTSQKGKHAKHYETNEVKLRVDSKSKTLQFWLPSKYSLKYYGKRQKVISFGVKDTEKNRLKAEQVRLQLELDLMEGNYQVGEEAKYKHPSTKPFKTLKSKEEKKDWTIFEVWSKYIEARKSLVAESTYAQVFSEDSIYYKSIKGLKQQKIEKASEQSEIRQELSEKIKGKGTLISALQWLSSAMEWARKEELIAKDHPNRFKSFKKEQEQHNDKNQIGKYKPPKRFKDIGENNREKIAFKWEEVEKIIEAYHSRNRRNEGTDYVAYMVELLFLTGMRHGEAKGLSWGDVMEEGSKLMISKSYSLVGNYKYTLKSTKNGKERCLPLNKRAKKILSEIKPAKVTKGEAIFKRPDGERIKGELWKTWAGDGHVKSILMPLVEQGKIEQYLKPYATRKTFITHQLQNSIDPKTLAYWVGDEVETIMEYYSDINREIVPF